MIRYRPFLNCDPPALAELWCNQPPQRGLVQPMTTDLLERTVFSKPYFDRDGLTVAFDEGRLVGFAHAGFGCSPDGARLDRELGVVCLLMVASHDSQDEIAAELMAASERYLIQRGAKQLIAGGVYPANPFYLGLYGGSHSPGILESDSRAREYFAAAGYEEAASRAIMQRRLAGFRLPVDRQQREIRRQYCVEETIDPPTASWWEACTIGQTTRTLYQLVTKRGGESCGSLVAWDMEPIASSWGVRAAGMMELRIDREQRNRGLGTFLAGETLRQLEAKAVTLVEVQILADNNPALAMFKKLGFQQVDRGIVLQKSV